MGAFWISETRFRVRVRTEWLRDNVRAGLCLDATGPTTPPGEVAAAAVGLESGLEPLFDRSIWRLLRFLRRKLPLRVAGVTTVPSGVISATGLLVGVASYETRTNGSVSGGKTSSAGTCSPRWRESLATFERRTSRALSFALFVVLGLALGPGLGAAGDMGLRRVACGLNRSVARVVVETNDAASSEEDPWRGRFPLELTSAQSTFRTGGPRFSVDVDCIGERERLRSLRWLGEAYALARPSYMPILISALERVRVDEPKLPFRCRIAPGGGEGSAPNSAVLVLAMLKCLSDASDVVHNIGVSPRMLPTLRAERSSLRRACGESVFVDASDASIDMSADSSAGVVCERLAAGDEVEVEFKDDMVAVISGAW